MTRPHFLLLACLVLSACTPGQGMPPNDGGASGGGGSTGDGGRPPLLEVGTGTNQFIALTDGQGIDTIFGPQGGYHIWTALRAARSLDPQRIQVTVKVLKGTTELSSNPYRLNLVDTGTAWEWYGLLALVPMPSDVTGQDTTLKLEVRDAAGVEATAEKHVTPRPP